MTVSKVTLLALVVQALGAPTQPTLSQPPPPVGHLNSNITAIAGGSIPNASTPLNTLSTYASTGFQLLQFLEILEVYLYYEGLKNFTSGVYSLDGLPNDTLEVITKTAAQEDIHVATLTEVLASNNLTEIPPCNYSFPVSSPTEFFALANVITPTNFGSIIGLQSEIAGTDPNTILSSSSILATEVRHEVFLRLTAGEVPNPAPFDTGLPPSWAYNIGLQYTIPGSCPVEIALPTYPPLYRAGQPLYQFASAERPTTIDLEWDCQQQWVYRKGKKQLYVVWVNLANQPQYTKLNVTSDGKGTADVPKNIQDTAFIAITSLQPNNLEDLSGATLAGPLAVPIS